MEVIFLILGMALIVAGVYGLITGDAGTQNYGDVASVSARGFGVRLIGILMIVVGGNVVRVEWRRRR